MTRADVDRCRERVAQVHAKTQTLVQDVNALCEEVTLLRRQNRELQEEAASALEELRKISPAGTLLEAARKATHRVNAQADALEGFHG